MNKFEENVNLFIKHNEKMVLAIKGKWGVGKTFKWNQIVDRILNTLRFSNYSYISLFGLDDLKELQSGIFYNARPMNSDANSSTIKRNLKKVGNIAKHIPQVSKYANALSEIENSLVKDYLICIDDIERKSEKLSMSTLLGYVSSLSESNNCKIVLIFNDDTLNDKDKKEIDKYREKVIDLELEYSPNSLDNIDIVFKNHPYKDLLHRIFLPENLTNIRIIKHIKWNLDVIMEFMEDSDEAVKSELISTTAILTYVHHEPSIDIRANEIHRILNYRSKKDDGDSKLQKRISSLGYSYYEEHEAEIINYIADGWMDEDKFKKNIERLNSRQRSYNISSKLTEIFGLYNNNFLSTCGEVIEELEDFLEQYLEFVSIRELQAILETLIVLKDNFDKNSWQNKYVKLRINSADRVLIKQLKIIASDPELAEIIEEKEREVNQHHSIYAVLSKIIKNMGCNPEDEEYLGSHSTDEIYNFLINDKNDDLLAIIRRSRDIFRHAEGDEPSKVFGRNLHEALIRISKRSKLDRYRITEFFGIDLDDDTK